jgi:uncharacterized protein (DUF2147 family)
MTSRVFGFGCAVLVATFALQLASAQSKSVSGRDQIVGEWWTENREGRVRISKDRDGTFRGTTTCCVHQDQLARDIHNPRPELRSRSTVGIVIIWKLKYADGEYADGYVYNPRDGKTYRIAAKVIDPQTIKIRGYLGIPLLGESQIWKRMN